MNSRNATVFFNLSIFNKVVNGFGTSISSIILAHIQRFEIAWRASKHDGDLPAGFRTEQDKEKVYGLYQLYQIRVGPGHGYRAWVMFLENEPKAYWVYAFKKGKDRQPDDMERARTFARRYWEQSSGGNNASR